MFKILTIFFVLNFYSAAFSSIKEKIIYRMQITDNLSFNFIQTIGDQSEKGKCIIKYPKKIFCEYSNSNKKIIISNGKSLVIKNKSNSDTPIKKLYGTQGEILYMDTGKVYHKGGYISEPNKERFLLQAIYTPILSLSEWNNSDNAFLRVIKNKSYQIMEFLTKKDILSQGGQI